MILNPSVALAGEIREKDDWKSSERLSIMKCTCVCVCQGDGLYFTTHKAHGAKQRVI